MVKEDSSSQNQITFYTDSHVFFENVSLPIINSIYIEAIEQDCVREVCVCISPGTASYLKS